MVCFPGGISRAGWVGGSRALSVEFASSRLLFLVSSNALNAAAMDTPSMAAIGSRKHHSHFCWSVSAITERPHASFQANRLCLLASWIAFCSVPGCFRLLFSSLRATSRMIQHARTAGDLWIVTESRCKPRLDRSLPRLVTWGLSSAAACSRRWRRYLERVRRGVNVTFLKFVSSHNKVFNALGGSGFLASKERAVSGARW